MILLLCCCERDGRIIDEQQKKKSFFSANETWSWYICIRIVQMTGSKAWASTNEAQTNVVSLVLKFRCGWAKQSPTTYKVGCLGKGFSISCTIYGIINTKRYKLMQFKFGFEILSGVSLHDTRWAACCSVRRHEWYILCFIFAWLKKII